MSAENCDTVADVGDYDEDDSDDDERDPEYYCEGNYLS